MKIGNLDIKGPHDFVVEEVVKVPKDASGVCVLLQPVGTAKEVRSVRMCKGNIRSNLEALIGKAPASSFIYVVTDDPGTVISQLQKDIHPWPPEK
jgi:hypothetical protein